MEIYLIHRVGPLSFLGLPILFKYTHMSLKGAQAKCCCPISAPAMFFSSCDENRLTARMSTQSQHRYTLI